MSTIKSSAYLINPHCQAYEQLLNELALEWADRHKAGVMNSANEERLRQDHLQRTVQAAEARHEALSEEGLVVVEYWGDGEDNTYYVDLVAACVECCIKPAVPGQGGFCSDVCALAAARDY